MNSIKERGDIGEKALNEWLKKNKLSYVAVCQAKNSFSPLFTSDIKRPDFLLLLESIGLIAIDAKNYKLSRGVYTLSVEDEHKKSLAFERLFRIPLWYAYYNGSEKGDEWHWISALKAAEVGEVRKNKTTDKPFLAIKKEEFECIGDASDLAKLYTHRLPSASKLSEC